jgi:hypothetical protein
MGSSESSRDESPPVYPHAAATESVLLQVE